MVPYVRTKLSSGGQVPPPSARCAPRRRLPSTRAEVHRSRGSRVRHRVAGDATRDVCFEARSRCPEHVPPPSAGLGYRGTVASIRSDVLNVAFIDTGDLTAPAVILIHGWPDAARGWRGIADTLATSGWRVIVPDSRGTEQRPFCPRQQRVTVRRSRWCRHAGLGQRTRAAAILRRRPTTGVPGSRTASPRLSPSGSLPSPRSPLPTSPAVRSSCPDFSQARAFWYQWLMYVDAGVEAIRRARLPSLERNGTPGALRGGFDENEFAGTARHS